ncbi:hypothetical protein [Actinoplanes sp. NPDC051494]|uniref:hypothetical protein n=1 Tax=Actinoplanes sp. NPDC051494 TaxID=3363907 RepID=UPI0037AA2F22
MNETGNPTEALERLTAATEQYESTGAAHERARTDALVAVVAALQAGAEPTKVADASPFTAAYVRKIARENGIAPAKRGVKSKGDSSLKVVMPKPANMRASKPKDA